MKATVLMKKVANMEQSDYTFIAGHRHCFIDTILIPCNLNLSESTLV